MLPLIDEFKMARRIKTDAFNDEINGLIQAAKADMALVGILVNDTDPLIRRAVITYCRANFGSPGDYEKMKMSYDEQKAQLQTSSRYTAPTEVDDDPSGCY